MSGSSTPITTSQAPTIITVQEFEEKVLRLEEISITIRAPRNAPIADYNFTRKASDTSSINEWLDTRIIPRVGNYQFDIISSDYNVSTPHGRTNLGTLRQKYSR